MEDSTQFHFRNLAHRHDRITRDKGKNQQAEDNPVNPDRLENISGKCWKIKSNKYKNKEQVLF